MGKLRKRLTMAKYAKKYANVRAAIAAKSKGITTTAEENVVITPKEVEKVEEPKQQVIEAIAEIKPDAPAEPKPATKITARPQPKPAPKAAKKRTTKTDKKILTEE